MALTENSTSHNSTLPTEDNCENSDKLRDKLSSRLVLYLMLTSGFIVSYSIRNDINIAILAMVKNQNKSTIRNNSEQYCQVSNNATNNNNEDIMNYGGTLEWSPDVQNYVLSSIFWIYPISQLIGGVLTQKYGTKRVFGYTQLATSLTNLLVPWASKTHYSLAILIKFIHGLVTGFTWPATFGIIAHWVPLSERSLFVTCFQGYNIGIGLSYALGGFLIPSLGWESLFYATASLGLIWCVAWYFLAFDRPENHPRISSREKQYIRKHTVTSVSQRKRDIPWCAILRSMPVWSNGIASFGRVWVVFTFMVYGPQYMQNILGFKIETNGTISGVLYVCCYLTSLMFSYIGDKIISRNVISLTATRKIFTALAQVVPGFLCILIGYLGCNVAANLVAWLIAVVMVPAAFAGVVSNIVDIAPNLGGVVGGFIQTILLMSSIISPLLAGYLIRDGHTLSAWQTIFNIAGGMSISTYFVFYIWGSAEIQEWDYEEIETISRDEIQHMASKFEEDWPRPHMVLSRLET